CNQDLITAYAKKAGCSLKGLNIYPLNNPAQEICSASIHSILTLAQKNDILLTLPASKSDLSFKGNQFLGHTEYLRHIWKEVNLPMAFISPQISLLLLTDHIPLNKVTQFL